MTLALTKRKCGDSGLEEVKIVRLGKNGSREIIPVR